MVVMILSFLLSLIPTVALFYWLRSLRRNDAAYRTLCGKALRQGVLCSFVVLAVSGALQLLLRLNGFHETNPLLYQALYTFLVLALAEEAVKFLAFRRVLKKTDYPCSWMDVTLVMTLVGLGFGAIENLAVAIGSGTITMLIRAVCVAHGGYGFVMGCFYGKGLKTGKNGYKVLGFALVWLIHGLYDFSLSDELVALNENLKMIAVLLALLSLVLAIMLIVFFAKARKDARYTEPLRGTEAGSTWPVEVWKP